MPDDGDAAGALVATLFAKPVPPDFQGIFLFQILEHQTHELIWRSAWAVRVTQTPSSTDKVGLVGAPAMAIYQIDKHFFGLVQFHRI